MRGPDDGSGGAGAAVGRKKLRRDSGEESTDRQTPPAQHSQLLRLTSYSLENFTPKSAVRFPTKLVRNLSGMPDEVARQFEGEKSLAEESVFVSLTYDPLDASSHMARVKSPKAGAVVLFAGCTRDSFAAKTVTHLAYSTYPPLALKTLHKICCTIFSTHSLTGISVSHRLGRVDIGEESIIIAIAAPHRKAAWLAGEECLEQIKAKVEIWKEEWFEDGGVWRSNRDGQAGVPVQSSGGELPK